VIPNGFDASDFDGAPTAAHDGPFRLVHIGTFHPADLGAATTRNTLRRVRHRQVVPLGRTGHYLLHALAKWRDSVGSARAAERLALHLYGPVDSTHEQLIERLGLASLVTAHGYVAHATAVAALVAADAVFVPLHGTPDGARALVVPGKLYEARASERPVLAALPPGDGADLVRALRAGAVVPPTDAAALAAEITRLVDARERSAPERGCARQLLTAFSRRSLTARLVQVLEAAAERRGELLLADPWPAPTQVGESA
jgi:glycosyltransferase involved in cell wall biosynthesis